MKDWSGYPLQPGEPEYTDDDRFWDGTRAYHLTSDRLWKRESDLLDAADVMVFNLLDCSPNPRVGSKRVATDAERRKIVTAGLVRFVDDEGGLQRWESEDGTVLALLIGELRSPRIPF